MIEEEIPEILPPEEVLRLLRVMEEEQQAAEWYSSESQHVYADHLLCCLLRHFGQPEIADLFCELSEGWWYS